MSDTQDKQQKEWRIEIHDPRKSDQWETIREIDEDELAAAEEMRNEENKKNAPALIRIVRQTHF